MIISYGVFNFNNYFKKIKITGVYTHSGENYLDIAIDKVIKM